MSQRQSKLNRQQNSEFERYARMQAFYLLSTLLLCFGGAYSLGKLSVSDLGEGQSLCDAGVHQQAGYVDLDTGDKHYFYWYFESRDTPDTDPLVLWVIAFNSHNDSCF